MQNESKPRLWKRKNKEGAIYYALIEGKWKSTGETRLERAKTKAKKMAAELTQRMRFKEFAKGFFKKESGAMRRKREKGQERNEGWYVQSQARLETYIMPYFGDFYVDEITAQVVDNWLLRLESPKEKAISGATKNKIMTCLKSVLQEAVIVGAIDRNPVKDIEPFKEKGKERQVFAEKEIEALFPADDEELIEVWGGVLWACYFMVLRDTGHRMGEQAVLSWGDLFEENGRYGFTITKSQDWFTKKIKLETKTGYHRATLITERTYRLLMRHKEKHPWELIFSLDGQRGIISETARKHLKYAAKNAGIDLQGRTPYCFRHTANTNLLLKADPQQVRFLMGHRSEKETTNYNHPDRRLLAKKAAAIKWEK